jgi:hypothetical protein
VSPHFGIRAKDFVLVRFYTRVESWELFDLSKDPGEKRNVYGDVKYAGVVKELKGRLKKLIVEYEDKEALEIFNKEI